MKNYQMVSDESTLKIISNPTRLYILRRLISEALTISQLGTELMRPPSVIRQHILALGNVGLVELSETRKTENFVEKYYRASAKAFFVNFSIFPENPGCHVELVLGNDDLALIALADFLEKQKGQPFLHIVPIGSLDSLILLRNGYTQLAGCHLLDFESGNYNVPTIRTLFSNNYPVLVTLAERTQGLLAAKNNPLQIHGIESLTRQEVRFVNRSEGSGTRRFFDHQLQCLGIAAEQINGYNNVVMRHSELGDQIRKGVADTGIGLCAVAKELDLDFIPLYQEPYQLAIMPDFLKSPSGQQLLSAICDPDYQKLVAAIPGYSVDDTGKITRIG